MFQFSLSRVVLWTVLVTTTMASAQAQSRDDADDGDNRLSFGVVMGFPVAGTAEGVSSSINTSETDPPTVTNTLVDSAGFPFVAGAAVRYDIGERFGVGADLTYRRGGYDSVINIAEQVTDNDDGDLILNTFTGTRAHFWDVPLLGRYYMSDRSSDGPRFFATGGAAVRFVTGLSSQTELTDDDSVTDTDTTAIGPANDAVLGAVLGIGMRASDDVGIKVDIEFRYTRWFNPIFQSGPANSNANQADVMVALTF
jgi:hypothetical protein